MSFADKEKFDVVDENDSVMYCIVGKKALHNLTPGRFHRSSHLFIEIMGARFIIQLKSSETENAGLWSSAVSGHVRASESYKEAIIREANEELGLVIDPDELDVVGTIHPCEETGYEFATLFTYLMDDKTESIKPNPDEVDEVKILMLDDLIKHMDDHREQYSPAFLILMELFLTQYKK